MSVAPQLWLGQLLMPWSPLVYPLHKFTLMYLITRRESLELNKPYSLGLLTAPRCWQRQGWQRLIQQHHASLQCCQGALGISQRAVQTCQLRQRRNATSTGGAIKKATCLAPQLSLHRRATSANQQGIITRPHF